MTPSPEKNVPEKSSAFEFTERSVADTTGLQKKVLAQTRMKTLARGADWDYVAQVVHYTQAGIAKIKAVLGISQAVPGASVTQDEPAKKVADITTVTEGIVRKKFPNRHLIEVEMPVVTAPGESKKVLVRVWVRDSKNFRQGMKVPIVRQAGSDVWRLARKEPRWFGKW